MTPGVKPPELDRGLGPWAAIAIVVGTIIGTGIFIVPADMARSANSAAAVILVWVAGGALSLFGALSVAELAAALPEAGGPYAYLNRAYGPAWGFLFGWQNSVLGGPTAISTISAGLLRFTGFLFPAVATPLTTWQGFTLTWAQPLAVAAIILLTGINYLGVRLGGRIQIVLTLVKIAAVLGVIAIAFFLGQGSPGNFGSVSTPVSFSAFLTAMVAALWAYDGWINLTYVGSEVQNPERNLMPSLLGGVMLVCAVYIGTSVACFYVLPISKVAASSLVASDVLVQAAGPNAAMWLTVVMMICALGSLNSSILTNARVDYAMARDGLFFRAVRGVHPRFRTPGRALIFQGTLASLLALTGTFEDLYSLFVFAAWIFYGLQTAAVIRLRIKEPDLPRPYHTWGYPLLPILFILGALALTVNLWIQRPFRSSIGLLLILSGLLFYARWRKT